MSSEQRPEDYGKPQKYTKHTFYTKETGSAKLLGWGLSAILKNEQRQVGGEQQKLDHTEPLGTLQVLGIYSEKH